jgi:prophage antirepressor-like protein
VRVVDIDGAPWFVARDICVSINVYLGRRSGTPNVPMLCQKLDANETQFNRIELSSNGARRVALVSESGLYKLVMRSDKPEAKAFQDWVARESAAVSLGQAHVRCACRTNCSRTQVVS